MISKEKKKYHTEAAVIVLVHMLQKMGLAVAVKGIGSLGKLSIVIQNFHSKNRKINTSQQNYFLQFSLPVPSSPVSLMDMDRAHHNTAS